MLRAISRRRLLLVGIGCLAVVVAGPVDAQFRQRGFSSARVATADDFDGRFQFCRVAFGNDFRGDGGNWSVDYPRADINLSIRLAELTKTSVSMAPSGDPNHLIVRLSDPELFNCPFIMMTEVGAASINPQEAERLREYLLKGGFLWADDFWGSYAWEWWIGQLQQVLPPNEYPVIDLDVSHPLFQSQFVVKRFPQISSINFWAGSGGSTAECGSDCAVPHARAIVDRHGNIMVLMTHNTDFGDSWEREADDPTYFFNFSVDGYAFGINALLYAMTH